MKEITLQEKETARIYRRFYLALQLRDLCNEMPIHMVSRKYDTPRGAVQTLSQTCQGFAAGSECITKSLIVLVAYQNILEGFLVLT